MLFFDERFQFISAQDGGVQQAQVAASVGSNGASLTLPGIKAPKNGYCYVYVSNQSDLDVFFDDLKVTLEQGRILEENHYYSFGLKIAAISSKKYSDSYDGDVKNLYQMQGAFAELDEDIGWNDFALRNYDAQIGRWVQQDPFQQFASPYTGMGNDPVNGVDPSGGEKLPYMNFNVLTSSIQVASATSRAVSFSQVLIKTAGVMIKAFKAVEIVSKAVATEQVGELSGDGELPKVIGSTYAKHVTLSEQEIDNRMKLLNVPGLSLDYLKDLAKEEALSLTMYDVDNQLSILKTAAGRGGNASIGFGHVIHYGAIGSDQYDKNALEKEKLYKNGITIDQAFSLLKDDLMGYRMTTLNTYITHNKLKNVEQGVKDVFMDYIYNAGNAIDAVRAYRNYGLFGLYIRVKTGKIKNVSPVRQNMRLKYLREALLEKAADNPVKVNPSINNINTAYQTKIIYFKKLIRKSSKEILTLVLIETI